jgi:hypothetical protein
MTPERLDFMRSVACMDRTSMHEWLAEAVAEIDRLNRIIADLTWRVDKLAEEATYDT